MTVRATLLLALLLPAPVLSAQTPHQASALRGLRAVRVTVNLQSRTAGGVGLPDTSLLRSQVEMELRQAGVAPNAAGTSAPQLALSVVLLSRPEGPCRPDSLLTWYTFRLELRQWAKIAERPPTFVWAATW